MTTPEMPNALTMEELKKRSPVFFAECTYVYVRFEDFRCDDQAPEAIREALEQRKESSDRSLEETGYGRFGENVTPWLAEYFREFANCKMVGVITKDGAQTKTFESNSINYTKVREG